MSVPSTVSIDGAGEGDLLRRGWMNSASAASYYFVIGTNFAPSPSVIIIAIAATLAFHVYVLKLPKPAVLQWLLNFGLVRGLLSLKLLTICY
mgnify:CR=1 FL=1